MNLYETNKEIDFLFMRCVDEDGALLEGYEEELDQLLGSREEKILKTAKYVKELNLIKNAYKEDVKRIEKRIKVLENKTKNLSKYIETNARGGTFEDSEVRVSNIRSSAVDIVREELIPLKYRVQPKPTISKDDIGRDIKQGVSVPGATLIERDNIQIK